TVTGVQTCALPICTDARNVLRDQHVRYAVAVQITEAGVAPRAEVGGIEFLPKLWLGIICAEPGQFLLALLNADLDSRCRAVADRDTEILETGRRGGDQTSFP